MALEEWLISGGKLVTASDLAKYVKERINPEVRARNEALLSQNRVAPERLISQLGPGIDNETPTANSGLTQAPAALWKGKRMATPSGGSSRTDESATDPERTLTQRTDLPSETFPKAAPVERRVPPPRTSDATELVDFVPVGAAARESGPVSGTSIKAPLEKPASRRTWQVGLLLALVLLFALLVVARVTLR
jgi:hypothetical protein